jgi:hypothetical protein
MYKEKYAAALAKNKKTQRGGITLATTLAGPTMNIQTVIASADGDVSSGAMPHLLQGAPLFVALTQMLSQALTALSAWAATTVDATAVTCTKLASTGSGSASVQLRVVAWLPHTAVR